MKQYEAVMKVMEVNGGYATLGYLNQKVLKVPGCEWKTKTPFASIRRIVQDERFFFKIKPGLWALNKYRDEIEEKFEIKSDKIEKAEIFNHTYYQGLIVELGNIKDFETYVPPQDKNKIFLEKPLKELAKIQDIYSFTYKHVLDRAKTIDVVWFNRRRFPQSLFEIEHSTDFQNSLLKFHELQDFHVRFYIVSDSARKKEFVKKISYDAFRGIKSRVTFIDYESLSNLHSKSFELLELQKEVKL